MNTDVANENGPNRMADDIIADMNLDAKVRALSGDMDFWPGLMSLMKEDYYHTKPFPAGIIEGEDLPGLHFIDGPRGVVLYGGATSFPVSMARGASFDTDLEERIGEAIGKELRSFGGNLFGGVCINLLRHPAWGRAQETYGEDPMHLGAMGAALTRGVERHAAACVKHYALNSMENARFQVDVTISDRALHEIYLPHFKECVDAGATVVMSAYNSVNGEWAGQNQQLLNDILKDRWGFDGVVLTDFVFGMRDPKKAIRNGLDLEMPYRMVWGDKLKDLVTSGQIMEDELHEPLRRLIRAQQNIPQGDYPEDLRACEAHVALAREAAVKSMVLLRNNDKALPIEPTDSVMVLGKLARVPNLGDHGSSDGRPEEVVTPLDGLRETYPTLRHADTLRDDADANATRKADAVIVIVGYTHLDEGEYIAPGGGMKAFASLMPPFRKLSWMRKTAPTRAIWSKFAGWLVSRGAKSAGSGGEDDLSFGRGGDRVSLSLSSEDIALINQAARLSERVVVAIMAGSAVMVEEWHDSVPGIVMMWYPGMQGGYAFADLVSARENFSGRLPFVVPTDTAHLPYFDKDATAITYDLWHGYRLLDRDDETPRYPFGFGLGYSDISYSDLTLDRKTAAVGETVSCTLTLTNHGTQDQDEVVQLYAGYPGTAVPRPAKELKAFKRVAVPAGNAIPVTIDVNVEDLGYYDETSSDFVVETGEHFLFAGAHAEDSEMLKAPIVIIA